MAVARDDLRRAAPDFPPTGIHGGKAHRQPVEQFDPVEPGKPQLARHVDPVVETVKQPARPDHVVGIIEEIEVGAAFQDRFGHLAPFQKGGAAGIELPVRKLDPCFGQTGLEPFQTLSRAVVVGHLGAKKADLAIARLDDGARNLDPRAAVGDTDHGIHRMAVDIHDLDNRNAGVFQHRARRRGMFQPRDDHARGPPGQHFVKHRLFAFGGIIGDTEDRLQAGILKLFRNAAQHLGKDEVRQRRHDHGHQVDPLRGQRARDLVGHIAQRLRRLQDLFARGIRHVAPVPKHPADRHFRDAGGFGDVAQGQRAPGLGGAFAGHSAFSANVMPL